MVSADQFGGGKQTVSSVASMDFQASEPNVNKYTEELVGFELAVAGAVHCG